MSLSINKRWCRISTQISSQRQKHGDENVTALRIPVEQIMLTDRELNAILQEPHAHNALFDHKRAGKSPIKPMFEKRIKPLRLVDKLEGATVTITHGHGGLSEEFKSGTATLSKIELEPKEGGLVAMSCTINCTPTLNEAAAHLLSRLDSSVEIEIAGGEFAPEQTDLELGEADEPKARESAKDVVAAKKRTGKGNGSRPAAH